MYHLELLPDSRQCSLGINVSKLHILCLLHRTEPANEKQDRKALHHRQLATAGHPRACPGTSIAASLPPRCCLAAFFGVKAQLNNGSWMRTWDRKIKYATSVPHLKATQQRHRRDGQVVGPPPQR